MVTTQIRLCTSCGLRYPFIEGHVFGQRCPVCMGETRLILSRELVIKPTRLPNADPYSASKSGEVAVLLDNIRSAWNVGSIFRSADGFGFAHAYLCGITPTPENESVTKTSLGAEDMVTWSYHKDAVKLVNGLRKEGWKILALEEDTRAEDLKQYTAPNLEEHSRSVLILGNEVTGVDPELLEACDAILYIPMRGEKKSFNVAIAFGIAAYQLQKPDQPPT